MYSLSFNFHQRSWWIYVFNNKAFDIEKAISKAF